MMCSCFGSLPEHESKKAADQETSISLSLSQQLKDVVVRIVHAGGRIEMYENALPVSELTQKYPGMCIARPDVFRHPHQSVLSSDDVLLPGNKYFVVGSSTVEKLRRRQSGVNGRNDGKELSGCSSGDYAAPKDGCSVSLRKHVKEKKKKKNKQVVGPRVQRPRIWKEPDWEPSLTSIQEVSI